MPAITKGQPPHAPFLPNAPRLARRLSRTASEGDLNDLNKTARRLSAPRLAAVTRPLPTVEPAPPSLSNPPHPPLFTTVPNYLRDSS